AGNGIGGGGAGGRISISPSTNLFAGTVSAFGGGGFVWGGAGSIWINSSKQIIGGFPPTIGVSKFILNNGGHLGALSPVGGAVPFDMTIADGAFGLWTTQIAANVNNILITSNAWLMMSNVYSAPVVTLNTIIQAGGGITADGVGFYSPGSGVWLTSAGSGAGHGGSGGASSTG